MTYSPLPKPDLVAVFESYGARVQSGTGWRKATCPLDRHEDRSPSASLHEADGKWKCWSCGEHGDAIDIVMANENLDFGEAVKFIREHFDTDDSAREPEPASSLHKGTASRPGRRAWTPPWTRM